MGVRTKVDGFGAHGAGIDVTVTSRGAHGEGVQTTVNGEAAHGEGYKINVNGKGAHGEGQNVKVEGTAAHGEGEDTTVIGLANHGEGKKTLAGMKWTKVTNISNGKNGVLPAPISFNKTIETGYYGEFTIKGTLTVQAVTESLQKLGGDYDTTFSVTLSEFLGVDADYVTEWELLCGFENDCCSLGGYTGEAGTWTHSTKQGGSNLRLWLRVYADVFELVNIQLTEDMVGQFTGFELEKAIDGFATNDVYSIIQTNFDTSYIDVGKITGAYGKTINVDTLPEWKDAKTVKETVTREICVATFNTMVNADGDIDVILNFSTPLSVRVGLPLIYGAYYGDTYYSAGEGATWYFEVGTVSEHIITFPGVWSGGTPFTKAEVGFAMWYAFDGVVVPDGYDYEIPVEDTFKLLKTEQVAVSQAVYYFGVRKKPTIGVQTLGEAMHAEGRATNALYSGAHAGGIDSVASSINTFAHGAVAKATSRHAIALGDHAEAKDAFSAAIGQYTKTGRANQIAVGKYNAENPNAAFVVGWGTGDSDNKRKNIFTIDTDGNGNFIGGVNAVSFNGYTIEKSVPVDAKFTDTTYDLYASKNSTNGNVKIQLDPSTGSNDNVKIQGSGSTTVTTDSNGVITINSTIVDPEVEWSDVKNKPNIKVGTYVNANGETVPKTTAITIGNVVAENITNTASGDGAVSVGRGTRALANSAFAAGINTVAQGRNSLTTGDKGIAWSDNTFVSGSGALYTGTFTSNDLAAIETAWQNGTNYHIAANNRAAIFGQSNYAKGENSLAIGQRNKAVYKNQFVTG